MNGMQAVPHASSDCQDDCVQHADVVDAPPSLVSPGGVPVVTPPRPSITILTFRWQRSRLSALTTFSLSSSRCRASVEAGTGDSVELLALS